MFITSTHSNLRRAVCLGVGVGIFLTGSAIAAGRAHANTLPTSYEVHIANTQPDRLVLQSASATSGHWVFAPPKHINGRSSRSSRSARRTHRAGRRRRPRTSIRSPTRP